MASAAIWTHERLTEAFELHFEFDTLGELGDHLTELWGIVITDQSIRMAIKKAYPTHNFRTTVGAKKKMREFQERKLQSVGEPAPAVVAPVAPEMNTGRRVDYLKWTPHDLAQKHVIPADPSERGDLVHEVRADRTTVIISVPDAHIPQHDPAALEAVTLFIEAIQPDGVINHGDFLNLDAVTRHSKSSKNSESLASSFRVGAALVEDHANRYRAAGVRWWAMVEGNHELRLHRFILENASELYETHPTIAQCLRLRENGWGFVSYGGCVRVGSVSFTHGEKYNKHVADSIVTEQGNQVFGHTHRAQMMVKNTRPGHPEMAMSIGSVAKLSQPYEYHKPTDHVHACGVTMIGLDGSVTMLPVLIHGGLLRWPVPGGRVLVCDGNLKKSYQE